MKLRDENEAQISSVASQLFERAPDEEYIQEWTDTLRQSSVAEKNVEILSVFIFRLGQEWLALSTAFLKEVTHRRSVHCIPHQANKMIKGVVNLNGELKIICSIT